MFGSSTAGRDPPPFTPCANYNPDEDGDGVHNDDDVCPNTPPGTPVDESGRPLYDANGDCALDGQDIQLIVDALLGV